ncbi:HAD-IIIA family hydrolase [Legionella israelensis]|uniref:3-deoxy-D-manno-octulosonate 8-phosphate phosphatase KdsC n=1 Tax=Legionella israelensis TaxID=454 RepID=A0A0W0WI07_9GAMM|nr:HAD-IIIA family hydrolase [Legionella israelensis]KTD31941.1 hydrolase [Legionella israelensis]QBR83858.1 HAD-IIIA family hydrolase [Legionella israelensis]QBS10739.1 HAD-IIIA family hydrolase [Legionella israelensis]SCY28353.1 3-deoxy-D-manno-octulosonate 8-phosphate phosphatase (KDO 8-P phosphatase) [Legionella israelensis DSM 19235]STX57706.1 hydrolase [Legionella israelensis]
MNELIEKARQIKCLISDVDGVLTDGLLFIDNFGNELKAFQVQDGMGLKLLMAAGIEVAVITTSRNTVIDHRMKQLGIKLYYTGQVDKREAYQKIKETLHLADQQFAYIGDDLPDLPIIQQVGLGVAVANAVRQLKEFADWQTEQCGGKGAVREVCDLILNAQGKMDSALNEYLKQ